MQSPVRLFLIAFAPFSLYDPYLTLLGPWLIPDVREENGQRFIQVVNPWNKPADRITSGGLPNRGSLTTAEGENEESVDEQEDPLGKDRMSLSSRSSPRLSLLMEVCLMDQVC